MSHLKRGFVSVQPTNAAGMVDYAHILHVWYVTEKEGYGSL